MLRTLLDGLIFAAGLATIIWIGSGYIVDNPLALVATAAIALCYLAGAAELWRYRRTGAALRRSLSELGTPPPALGQWLATLPQTLRDPVRLRVEGERVALPGPALTPYLVGMLVLLGMLGTLLGMMATLRGTGLALETATDLDAMRASLAAPVKGLSFAFGTSIAGVAASAMLGLLSTLCRREQARTGALLDHKIATSLHGHSPRHQHEQVLQLLQRHTESMPLLVDRLQVLAATVEQQQRAEAERQLAAQQAFHERSEAANARFTEVVEQTLRQGLADGAQAHSAALQPAVETTLAALAQQAGRLQSQVGDAVQRQLDALHNGWATTTAEATAIWRQARTDQQHGNQQLRQDLHDSLNSFSDTFEQRSTALLEAISGQLQHNAEQLGQHWQQALTQQQEGNQQLTQASQQLLADAAGVLERQSLSLLQRLEQSQQHAQADLAAQEQQRQRSWSTTLGTIGQELRQHWVQAADATAQQQQAICATLQSTADTLLEHCQSHAQATIGEVSRLLENATEAPKAAAAIISELRQNLAESMARDTAALERRDQVIVRLEHLLDGAGRAAEQQRGAIEALVESSTQLLERTSMQLAGQVQTEADKLGLAAADVGAGAIEIASVGDAFGAVVQQFGDTNERLSERLQLLESTLARSLERSDEQLAYYVAQAREVVDLSVLSQRQIIEELQQAGHRHASDGATPA